MSPPAMMRHQPCHHSGETQHLEKPHPSPSGCAPGSQLSPYPAVINCWPPACSMPLASGLVAPFLVLPPYTHLRRPPPSLASSIAHPSQLLLTLTPKSSWSLTTDSKISTQAGLEDAAILPRGSASTVPGMGDYQEVTPLFPWSKIPKNFPVGPLFGSHIPTNPQPKAMAADIAQTELLLGMPTTIRLQEYDARYPSSDCSIPRGLLRFSGGPGEA